MQLNTRKTTHPIKNLEEDLNRHFSKEDTQMANKHKKRGSTWLIIRKMQIKTTMRYYLKPVRMAIIKKSTNNKCWASVQRKGNPFALLVGMIQSLWRMVWRFLKNLGIKLPYDPAIHYWAYKTITKKSHVPQYSQQHYLQQLGYGTNLDVHWQADEWIKKLWYIYTKKYYSAIKRNTSESVLVRQMNLEPVTQVR